MSTKQIVIDLMVGAIVLFSGIPTTLRAQTHFAADVRGETSAVCNTSRADFQTLTVFRTPGGVAQGQQTLFKFVTERSGLLYQVQRSAAETATVTPGGPGDSILDKVTTNPVASVLAQVVAEPVAPGHALVQVVVVYADFDLGAGEEWSLKVCVDTIDREYFGFEGKSKTEVTREKISAADSIDFGEVEVGIGADIAPRRPVAMRNVGTARLTINQGLITNDSQPAVFTRTVFAPGTLAPGEELENDFSGGSGIWVRAVPTAAGPRSAVLTLISDRDSAEVQLRAAGTRPPLSPPRNLGIE